MNPSHQCFGAGKHGNLGGNVELRLEKYAELLVLNRAPEILEQPLGVDFFFVQRFVEKCEVAQVVVAHRIRRHFGAVESALHLHRFVCDGVNAHAQPHTVSVVGVA